MQTALRRCLMLVGCSALLWVLLVGPAWALAGADGVEGLSYAALLCTIPGCLIFLATLMPGAGGKQSPWVFLGGMSLRLVFVLVGTLIINSVRPGLGLREFLVWLGVYYMVTLAVETFIAVRQTSAVYATPPRAQ